MKLAFVLFKYFPYSGLARDCLRIAEECLRRGHQVNLYAMIWLEGEKPAGIKVKVLSPNRFAWSNHAKIKQFHQQFIRSLKQNPVDLVIGFNRMPDLDVYYAADPCFKAKAKKRPFFYQYTPRYRFYHQYEAAVFSATANVELLLIAKTQIALFKTHYETPPLRFHLLPPGIALDRKRPANAAQQRPQFRQTLGLKESDFAILMVGSVYQLKGVDRTLKAIASLPEQIKRHIKLMVAGLDNSEPYLQLAEKLGIQSQILFMEARKDIPKLLLSADILLHPARHENTGTVLLEAVAMGLPQIVSGICGYAFHIQQSKAGLVLDEPFSQTQYNQQVLDIIQDKKTRMEYQKNALAYAKSEDLYQMPQRAVDIIEGTKKQRKKANVYQQGRI